MKQKMIFLTALFIAAFAFSAEYYVDASRSDDTGSATNWATAKQTIQAAVDLAADGDTIWVTNGVYDVGGAMGVDEDILSRVCISKDVRAVSVNGPDVTVISGNGPLGSNAVRCAYLSGDAVLDGFTLMGGHTSRETTMDQYRLGKSSAHGGGAYLTQNAIVKSCLIVSNFSAIAGGGAFCQEGGRIEGCLILDNVSGVFELVDLTINGGPIFVTNQLWMGDGGGVYLNDGGSIVNCSLSGNHTVVGESSFVSGNGGNGYGGGVFCSNGSIVQNNIIFGNDARYGRGDVAVRQNTFPVFQNNMSGAFLSGIGNITNAPQFVDAAGGDFRLQSNSPCINWGDNSVVSNATDLDGNPRIVEDVVDMGAYEYQNLLGLTDSDGDGIPDDWERQHGGNQNPERIGSNGVNTVREAYIVGLNPNDPADLFEVSNVWNVLGWPSVSGRVYSIYYTTNLLESFQPLETNIPWTAGSFTDTNTPSSEQMFYKIEVQFDDGEESLGGGGEEFEPGGGGEWPSPFDPGDGGGDDGDTAATPV